MASRQIMAYEAQDGTLFKSDAEAAAHDEAMYWGDFYKTRSADLEFESLTEDDFRRIITAWEAYKVQRIVKDINTTPISSLNLTVRAQNILHAEGIKTIGMLVEKGEMDIFKLPNMGRKCMSDIKTALGSIGLSFKQ